MTNRKEVAKKLRENSTVHTTDEAYVVLLNCMGITYDYANLLNRLADLIDPVCHAVVDLESDGIGAPYRYTSRCSNCGQVWGEAIYFPHVPIYCPACGARVVRDDL